MVSLTRIMLSLKTRHFIGIVYIFVIASFRGDGAKPVSLSKLPDAAFRDGIKAYGIYEFLQYSSIASSAPCISRFRPPVRDNQNRFSSYPVFYDQTAAQKRRLGTEKALPHQLHTERVIRKAVRTAPVARADSAVIFICNRGKFYHNIL